MAIFGNDDRVLVSNSGTTPFVTFVQVISTFSTGTQVQGSGVLVGENDVLTSGHLVYDSSLGELATSIAVIPGRSGENKPLGIHMAGMASVPTTWSEKDSFAGDYALLGLSFPVGRVTGTFSLQSINGLDALDETFRSWGYPSGLESNSLYGTLGTLDQVTGNLLYFNDDLDLSGGQSGSALVRRVDGLDVVVGVVSHSTTSPEMNAITSFGTTELSQIQSWAVQNDSLLADWRENPLYSSESVSLTSRVYSAVLGRTADEGGINYWLDRFDGGLGLRDMVSHFLYSAEYQQSDRFGYFASDPQQRGDDYFLQQVYSAIFGRDPDSAGESYWLERMASGLEREELLLDFIYSGEYTRQQAYVDHVVQYEWFDSYDMIVAGNEESERFSGTTGADYISGAAGNDTLSGGVGSDWLFGGEGSDTLNGGAGADFFVVKDSITGTDLIEDFSLGEDYLRLEGSWQRGNYLGHLVYIDESNSSSVVLQGVSYLQYDQVTLV